MKRYYKLNEAINAETESTSAFILANEMQRKSGGIGRYYTVFDTFNLFLQNRHKYPHCHEIIVDHCNLAKPNKSGRLVFDFDIKLNYNIPEDFQSQVEETIRTVAQKHMTDVDVDKFIYVWSSSPNKTKVSKHLTVKHCCFENWQPMVIIFYNHFIRIWNESYDWIKGSELIDEQITRTRGSLRMTGSSKIGGSTLELEDDYHSLLDSLIRLYRPQERKREQMISKTQLAAPQVLKYDEEDVKCTTLNLCSDRDDGVKITHSKIIVSDDMKLQLTPDDILDPHITEKAYAISMSILQSISRTRNVFEKRNINKGVIYLNRVKPAPCLLSGRVHECEHACLILINDDALDTYHLIFKCFRNCGRKKNVKIAEFSATVPHDIEILVGA